MTDSSTHKNNHIINDDDDDDDMSCYVGDVDYTPADKELYQDYTQRVTVEVREIAKKFKLYPPKLQKAMLSVEKADVMGFKYKGVWEARLDPKSPNDPTIYYNNGNVQNKHILAEQSGLKTQDQIRQWQDRGFLVLYYDESKQKFLIK